MIGAVGPPPASTALDAVHIRVHDLGIGVRSGVPAVIEAVATSYAAFVVDEPRGNEDIVWIEGATVLDTLDRIVMAVIDGLAERGVVGTHAAALAIDGRAVILAGRSGAGKSTMTLALLRDGASLLTDELTLIDADDRMVLPYPRSLHVSPATADLLPELRFLDGRERQDLGGGSEWSVSTGDLERAFGTVVAGPTPLAVIVLLDERGDPTSEPRLDPLPGAEAAIALVRGTPAAARDFAGTLARLGGIASRVPAVRLSATEPTRTAATLRHHLVGLP